MPIGRTSRTKNEDRDITRKAQERVTKKKSTYNNLKRNKQKEEEDPYRRSYETLTRGLIRLL